MKIKILILLILSSTILYVSCNNDDDTSDDFDPAAQSLIDDETIKTYLNTHYYIPPTINEDFGVIDTILNGETPLMNLAQIQEITRDDIIYKLYYVKATPEGNGESPIYFDDFFTKYQGYTIDDENIKFDERITYNWIKFLDGRIMGWSYGFQNFKSGSNIVSLPDEPIKYDQPGKGIIFIPSGLAYKDIGVGDINPNTPLLFHIELGAIHRDDQDADGIYTMFEDLNEDQDYENDDTDNDDVPNYLDSDDDNDHIWSIYENGDPNGDGNPDDAIDSDGDNIPDYLDDDDDNDGIPTYLEEADPNGDGNPDDAIDSDGDNIPDYLDLTN